MVRKGSTVRVRQRASCRNPAPGAVARREAGFAHCCGQWRVGAGQSNDPGQLEPMIRAALAELEQAGVEQQPETVLADSGYWNSRQIAALGDAELQVIVPTKSATRTKAARRMGVSPATANTYAKCWRQASAAERVSLACLLPRSSRAKSCPWALSAAEEQRILEARAATNWGPMRLQVVCGRHVEGRRGRAHRRRRKSIDNAPVRVDANSPPRWPPDRWAQTATGPAALSWVVAGLAQLGEVGVPSRLRQRRASLSVRSRPSCAAAFEQNRPIASRESRTARSLRYALARSASLGEVASRMSRSRPQPLGALAPMARVASMGRWT
jgi:hypothetical protein